MKQILFLFLLLLLSGDSWQLNTFIKSQTYHDSSSSSSGSSLHYLFAKFIVFVFGLTSLADEPASLLLKSFVSVHG